MPTNATIRQSLKCAVQTISTANGYLSNIPPENVRTLTDPLKQVQSLDMREYPKVLVWSEGAHYKGLPSRTILKREIFSIIAVFSAPASTSNTGPELLEGLVENFISDMESLCDRNPQVGGADLVELIACADDLGANSVEACVTFELAITYRRNFANGS